MRSLITAATAAALTTALAAPALAADHTVCASNCDFDAIQDAIDASASGDAIYIGDGTYQETLSVDHDLDLIADTARAVDVVGDGTATLLFVDFGATVTVSGLDFMQGGGDAAIINLGTLTLDASWVMLADAYLGAVYNAGDLTIEGASVIADNVGEALAGGITNAGDLLIDGCTILGNQGYMGGGLANINGSAFVYASSFSNNQAETIGGAWSNHNTGGDVTFAGSSSMSSNSTGTGDYQDCYDLDGHPACTQ